MNRQIIKTLSYILLITFWILPATATDTAMQDKSIYQGYFSGDGNNDSPSVTSRNNIYIKLFENQRVAMLYIPYPYAKTVTAPTIEKVFQQARSRTSGSAYLRGEFGQLKQAATVQIEKFGYLDDRLVFECGALSPCTIKLHDGFLELIKPGVINEHIIKYRHVFE